jgi:GT2 family glycosyltransferase
VAFLDHDDELEPTALHEFVALVDERPRTDVVYSDEDKLDPNGHRCEAFFKPDWSPEYFRGVMYVGHLLMIRRSLVEEVGGFDPSFDGVQDYELMLRVSERNPRIEHLPLVLYHWRKIPGSLASSSDAKPSIGNVQARAVQAHLDRAGIPAVAAPHDELPHRAVLRPKPRSSWPSVSIVIPTKDAPEHISRCLDSIYRLTDYNPFEVVVVDTGTQDPAALAAIRRHPVVVEPFDEPFNFSRAINAGVAASSGELVVLLNNDTEVVDRDWLQTLAWLAELPGVGAVGPLLVYPDRTVQHAGVVLGFRGTADHVLRGAPATGDGYAGSLAATREVSAVTAACLMVRRSTFDEVGGLNEYFGTHYQDVDFCLKLRKRGLRNLFTPRAALVHHESASRGSSYDRLDRALLLDRWQKVIDEGDPYYSPHFSLDHVDYRIDIDAAAAA